MKSRSLSLLLCLVILSVSLISAQTGTPTPTPTPAQLEKTQAQKEIEKRVVDMLDQALSDAGTLKLAQNRAVVFALAGDLYWQFDEKRARELFRTSANEIMTANIEADKEKKDTEDPYAGIFEFGQDYRSEILPLIAKHDADLALEILVQTRPARLIEAMAKAALPNTKQDGGGMFDFNPDRYRIQQEVALEQRFAVLAAEQNPDKAIKVIKDSLAKGISWNVMPLLQKLNEKDPKKAQSLADDVVAKIVDTDLSKKMEDLQTAIRFVQGATNPNAAKETNKKKFKFTDTQLRDIANKLAATFLQATPMSFQMSMVMGQVINDLEKFVPERMPVLKQKQAEAMKSMPPEFSRMQQQQKIWNPNSTPEEILAGMPKYNEIEKASANQALIGKIAYIDDDARAKKLIDQIPDEKIRDQARERYESARISRASKEGKLDEAKKLISNLTKKKTQIQKLVSLALEFYKKNTDKDKETAAGLMKDAKALANEFPEDEDELNDLMEIVKGYAIISPPDAFRLFEPVVDQINDFLQASAILSKYNKRNRNFKKAELVMRISGSSWDGLLLFRYIKQMQMMGKADLNRMALLTDRFQRSDARTIVKLFVAQGALQEDKKTDGNSDDEDMSGMYFEIEG